MTEPLSCLKRNYLSTLRRRSSSSPPESTLSCTSRSKVKWFSETTPNVRVASISTFPMAVTDGVKRDVVHGPQPGQQSVPWIAVARCCRWRCWEPSRCWVRDNFLSPLKKKMGMCQKPVSRHIDGSGDSAVVGSRLYGRINFFWTPTRV